MAIAIMQFFNRQGRKRAIAHHDIAIDQYILHLAAISPAVHAHKAADCAGNGPKELKPRNAIVPRG